MPLYNHGKLDFELARGFRQESILKAMSSNLSNYQILVVDDSPVYRKLIEHMLAGEAYSLIYARDGEEALQLLAEHSPSMVITDWTMPDISGVELCRRIRADKSRPYAYLILMTGNTEETNVVEGLEAGADDFLTKPFDDAEMLARIGVGRQIVDLHRELARKARELEAAARTDSLTGLPNRKALEEWAGKEILGALRHGFSFWLVVCDIDSFKGINDTFGHDAGDAVLRAFSDLLKVTVRKSDLCGRLGGDEFLLLITHVNPEGVELTVNRVREGFANLSFPFAGQSVKVTASFSAVGFQGKDVRHFKELLQKADQMLQEAKRNGRNRVGVQFLSEACQKSIT